MPDRDDHDEATERSEDNSLAPSDTPRERHTFGIADFFTVVMILCICAIFARAAYSSVVGGSTSATAERSTPAVVEEPAANEAPESSGSSAYLFGGALLAAAAAGVSVYVYRGHAGRPDTSSAVEVMWRELDARRNRTWEAFVKYEMDPVAAFEYPVMHDLTEPATVAFHEAYAAAEAIAAAGVNPDRVERFAAAVVAFELAWEHLEELALRIGLGRVGDEYRRDVEQAVKLLRQGLSTPADAERDAFTLKAYELIGRAVAAGEIRVPKRAAQRLAELGGGTRPALPAGGPDLAAVAALFGTGGARDGQLDR